MVVAVCCAPVPAHALGWRDSGIISTNTNFSMNLVQASTNKAAVRVISGGSSWMWLYDGTTSKRIGLFGGSPATDTTASYVSKFNAENAQSDTVHDSNYGISDIPRLPFQVLDTNGYVSGWSTLYIGTQEGRAAWRYNPVTNASGRIGFFEGFNPPGISGYNMVNSHTKTQYSIPFCMNDYGNVVGISEKYDINGIATNVAWYYDGTTKAIMMPVCNATTDRTNGIPWLMNNNNLVAGNSSCGSWISNAGAEALAIGFRDTQQTTNTNCFNDAGHVLGMNAQGQVIGKNIFYYQGVARGQSAWIASLSGTTKIGIYHSSTILDGDLNNRQVVHSADPWFISDNGYVVGRSLHPKPVEYEWADWWLYTGSSTHLIGYTTDPVTTNATITHTNTNLDRDNIVLGISKTGHAYGHAQRYKLIDTATPDSNKHGQTAWLAHGPETIRLGFHNATEPYTTNSTIYRHTSTDGREESVVVAVNSAGQAIGFSSKYNGNSFGGVTGWLYEATNGTTTKLAMDETPTGYSYTIPQYITETGEVYGSIWKAGNWHLFYWSKNAGFRNISEEAGGMLTDGTFYSGFSYRPLIASVAANGDIIGSGCWIKPGTSGCYTKAFVVYAGTSKNPPGGGMFNVIKAKNGKVAVIYQ